MGDLYLLTGSRLEAEGQFALAEAIWRLRTAEGYQPDIHRVRFYADHDRNLSLALAEAEKIYRTRKNIAAADALAWCYYKNGRDDDARRMIRRALRLGTPHAQIRYHAGMIYARLGDRPLAREYLRSALELDPHFHPVDAGRAAEALKQLEKGG
jgi:tetratricopeptide (TPR) repeat protein